MNEQIKNNFKIKTEVDYLVFVENYIILLESEISNIETLQKKGEKIASRLPLLISLVNTVEAFRGQNNLFVNFRNNLEITPNNKIQQKLRKYEDIYVSRIDILIENTIKKEDLNNDFHFQYFGRIYLDRGLKKYLNYKNLNDVGDNIISIKNIFNIRNIFILIILAIFIFLKLYVIK